MKILITGANGLLGQYLVSKFLRNDHKVIAVGKGPFRLAVPESLSCTYVEADLADAEKMNLIFDQSIPDVLIHCAAMTQVDECEQNPANCFEINTKATGRLLDYARRHSVYFIFLSTDFVFDGKAGPYNELDDPRPVSVYGESKWAAENLVLHAGIPNAVVRTCLVYGKSLSGTRNNIVTWVADSLRNGKPIRVVNDQFRTPTYVEDLADGIVALTGKRKTGIYHISGKETLTPYQMALRTARFFGLDEGLIEKVDASVFSQPAKRPPRTGFDISKAERELDFRPRSFEEGLRKMVSVS